MSGLDTLTAFRPAWSPDGNSLLFGAREKRGLGVVEADAGLFFMNLDTAQLHSLGLWDALEPRSYNRLTWGPDGSHLMISVSIYEPLPELNGIRVVEELVYLIDSTAATVSL